MMLRTDAPPRSLPDYNRVGIDFRRPTPRPKVRGPVIDFHVHVQAQRHAAGWFEAAEHFGFEKFVTMTPLEEAVGLARNWPGRFHFIAIPRWGQWSGDFVDEWLQRIDAFHNLGSRIVKFWFAPPAIGDRKWRLDSEMFRPLLRAARDRGMAIMTHIGDPDAWYKTRYADAVKYGTRDDHYQMWRNVLEEYRDWPWLAAHLAGNPENLSRLQSLLDDFPDLYMDCSATRWIVRELSNQRDAARDFFIRNQNRIIFGTDQVTSNDRGYDFLSSRFWVHRKFWETAYIGASPIFDPDLSDDQQPTIRGLALPDECLQKLYHDNAVRFMQRIGATFV